MDKVGLDIPFTYRTALNLFRSPQPVSAGRGLGWGSLRVFHNGSPWPILSVQKQGVEIYQLSPLGVEIFLSGSYRTTNTLNALNLITPYQFRRGEGGDWWIKVKPVHRPEHEYLLTDSLSLGWTKLPSPSLPLTSELQIRLSAGHVLLEGMIDKYVRAYIAATLRREIEHPSAAGCWTCYLNVGPRGPYVPTKGAEPDGIGHIYTHLTNLELEPNVAWRALMEAGISPLRSWERYAGGQYYGPDLESLPGILRSFFRSRFSSLLARLVYLKGKGNA